MEQQPAIQFYLDQWRHHRAYCRYRDWDSVGYATMVFTMQDAAEHLRNCRHPQTIDKEE